MYVRDEANNAPVLPVAIVGAALRFPGAFDPASYHEITSTGRRMFRELARTAVDHGRAHLNGTGPLFSLDGVPMRAALLDDRTPESRNDTAPSAAGGATSRQALAEQITAAALADVPDAGRAKPSRTGAIIADSPEPDAGAMGAVGAGEWVCDRLGLPGPGASRRGGADRRPGVKSPHYGGQHPSCSLAAVVAACEVLNSGELDLVLAGGVSTGINQAWLDHRGRAGKLATEDVRIYDTSPTGTLPGEGCGVVALMRATDARAAELPVYAEIAGWHVAACRDVGPADLWPAYLRADVDPMDVQLMEGHGAATAAQDLAELSALAQVLGPHVTGAPGRCAFGAVTANIGDTRSAAGVAALLKTALAMTAGVIPATTGCVRPHRLLRADTTPFRLPLVPELWPETITRVAAVNTLGVDGVAGGSGSGPVHLVLRREPDSGRAGRRRRATIAAHGANRITVPPPRPPSSLLSRTGSHVAPPRPRTPQDSHSPEAGAVLPGDAAPEQASASNAPQPAPASDVAESAPAGDALESVAASRHVEVVGEVAAQAGAVQTVIAVRGADREDLAVMLDTIAITAAHLHAGQLGRFARELAATRFGGQGGVRAAILASDPAQLAARAARAAALLRAAGPGPVRIWPEPEQPPRTPPLTAQRREAPDRTDGQPEAPHLTPERPEARQRAAKRPKARQRTAVPLLIPERPGTRQRITEQPDAAQRTAQQQAAEPNAEQRDAPLRTAQQQAGQRTAERPKARGRTGERPEAAQRTAERGEAARLAGASLGEPGVYLSEGASGRVVLVFPGLVDTAVAHMATLATSLATLAMAERLGVRAHAAVGYSLGEITALAWAGSVSFGEAARLAACRAEIVQASSCQTAMARVLVAPGAAERLRMGTRLVLAADEGPAQQVLAGPAADIGELSRRAADQGIAVNVLDVPCALHSPAAEPCLAPWRAAIRDQRIEAPRRRVISSVTGLDIQVCGDIRWLLAAQLTRPALLAGALALASADADLLLLTAPDAALAAAVAACGRAPVFGSPLEQHAAPTPTALAALYAAGAIDSVAPFLANAADPGQSASPSEAATGAAGTLGRW